MVKIGGLYHSLTAEVGVTVTPKKIPVNERTSRIWDRKAAGGHHDKGGNLDGFPMSTDR